MNELTMALQPGNGRHLYEQIYEYIRDEIKGGRLLVGEKLPSARSLAEYLQVSRSTVDLAYDQLLSEGYIEAIPRKGYFVCQAAELYRLDSLKKLGPDRNNRKILQDSTSQMQESLHFSPNAVDMRYFPFSVWKKITRETLIDDRKELFTLGEPQGDRSLRETICRYLHASRGVSCTPEQVVVGAGNDYLLMLLYHILGEGRRIAMENPTYPKAYRIFRAFSYPVTLVGADGDGMEVKSLRESGAQLAYVMPSHQFPMGTVMPIGRRLELLAWAEEKEGRYLIEDDYDSEFRYKGKPIPSLQGSDRSGKVIYIGTFSKSIAPAIRVSFLVLPESLLPVYALRGRQFSSTVSRIDQTVLNEFLGSGAFERHLNKMRKVYKTKHDLLLTQLRPLRRKFRISGENAGLHLLLCDREGRGEETLVRLAAGNGVRVEGLSGAYVQDLALGKRRSTVLLGFAGLTEAEICTGVERLKEVWL